MLYLKNRAYINGSIWGLRATQAVLTLTLSVLCSCSFIQNGKVSKPKVQTKATAASSTQNGDGVTGSSYDPNSTPTKESAFKVTQALKSMSNSNQIDLIGDATGSFPKFCNSTDACQCVFNYKTEQGATEEVQTKTTLIEENLLRCDLPNFALTQTSKTDFSVYIKVMGSELVSNSVGFARDPAGFDDTSSLLSSYDPIVRYPCQMNLFINYLWSYQNAGSAPLYNPILSEDQNVSPRIHFYSAQSKLVSTLFKYSAASVPDLSPKEYLGKDGTYWFDCPSGADLLAHQKDDLSELKDSTWANMVVFSTSSQSGAKLLYPSEVKTQLRFMLSKKETPTFNVALTAQTYPAVSSTANVTAETLGYGAFVKGADSPCPSLAIPAGTHWVKLWKFKATITSKGYPSFKGARDSLAAFETTYDKIACHPKSPKWDWDTSSADPQPAPSPDAPDTKNFFTNDTGQALCADDSNPNTPIDSASSKFSQFAARLVSVKNLTNPSQSNPSACYKTKNPNPFDLKSSPSWVKADSQTFEPVLTAGLPANADNSLITLKMSEDLFITTLPDVQISATDRFYRFLSQRALRYCKDKVEAAGGKAVIQSESDLGFITQQGTALDNLCVEVKPFIIEYTTATESTNINQWAQPSSGAQARYTNWYPVCALQKN